MGHAIDYFSVSNEKSIITAAQEFAQYNTDRQENPSGSYHGNMTIHKNIVCENWEEAVKYIKSKDNGWYSDHAVQYKDNSGLKKTKAEESIEERIKKNRNDKFKYIQEHSIHKMKSNFVTCKKCGSKIATHYNSFTSEYCPVCREDLRAEYISERIEKYDIDFGHLEQELMNARQKRKGKANIKWCVKVEVHC